MNKHIRMITKMDLMNQRLPDMKMVVEGTGSVLALAAALAAAVICEENLDVEKYLLNSPALVAIACALFPRRQQSVS